MGSHSYLRKVFWITLILSVSCYTFHCQGLGPGSSKKNTPLSFPIEIEGVSKSTSVTIDQNWRWWHASSSTKNCYDNGWDKTLCSTEESCSKNCVIEGVDTATYLSAYGVSVTNKVLRLNYARKNDYGLNIGSRVYLLDDSGQKYQGFDLRQKELLFDIDLSTAGCGLNSAVYLVEMPLSDPYGVGSAYGVNYGDAQCAQDIKFIGGNVNFGTNGACSFEMDILEANRHATAITAHTCSIKGVTVCKNDTTCGNGANRYSGYCDKNGADYNPYRMGNRTVYGYGSNYTIDSSKPFTVSTSFFTDDGTAQGKLVRIERTLIQNGQKVYIGALTDQSINVTKQWFKESNHFAALGGLKAMGESLSRNMVLTFSFWDDSSTHMQWLDSTYGGSASSPGVVRGPCPNPPLSTDETRQKFVDAYVLFSNVKVRSLSSSSTTPSPTKQPTQSPSRTPTKTPTSPSPSPSPSSSGYYKCNQCTWVQ